MSLSLENDINKAAQAYYSAPVPDSSLIYEIQHLKDQVHFWKCKHNSIKQKKKSLKQ